MEESTGSCGPLKHDDIKVPIKYFFVTMRTTQKTPRSQKGPNQPKPRLFVYSPHSSLTPQQHGAAWAELVEHTPPSPRDSKTITLRNSKPTLPHRTEGDGGGWDTGFIAVHTEHQ